MQAPFAPVLTALPRPALAPRAAPRWRALALLAVLVLVAHALVLQTSPQRFDPELVPATRHTQTFLTRRIDMPPPVDMPTPPAMAVPHVKSVAKSVKKPKPKAPAAAASETSAQPVPEGLAPDHPDTSAAAPEMADTAPDPAAAASEVADTALPPAGPDQRPVMAVALPASTRLEYKATGSAKGLNYHANSQLDWQNAGTTYHASMTVSALFIGSRSMTSQGQLAAEGLAPSRFSDKYRTEVAAHFEPEKGQISFSANTPSVPWVKGAQDRVSVFLQLGGLLAGNPTGFPVGATLSMYTVGPRDAESWTFLVEAVETLTLPFGELSTLKLSRQPRREHDQKVEVWFAPALGYLPVRNKITQSNGDFVDQQLSAMTPS